VKTDFHKAPIIYFILSMISPSTKDAKSIFTLIGLIESDWMFEKSQMRSV
jgi:hypothetical protein